MVLCGIKMGSVNNVAAVSCKFWVLGVYNNNYNKWFMSGLSKKWG